MADNVKKPRKYRRGRCLATEIEQRLARLRSRYSRPEVPPCCVCGGELILGMIGQGRAEWYCESADAKASLRHWQQSQHNQTQFLDEDVLALCDEVERLQNALAAATRPGGSRRSAET